MDKQRWKTRKGRIWEATHRTHWLFDENHIQLIANDEMEEPIGLDADDHLAEELSNVARTTTNRPVNDMTAGPDSLVGAEIFLPHGDRNEIARVMWRKRNSDGLYIGRAHRNPMLDSRVFTVEFPDGDQQDLGLNIIVSTQFTNIEQIRNKRGIEAVLLSDPWWARVR
jgi:hypothetical protein